MYELLHRITGEGLGVEYCFSRQPFSPDHNMVAVQIQFTNNTSSETKNLHIEEPKMQSGMRIKEFTEIGQSEKISTAHKRLIIKYVTTVWMYESEF